MRNDPDPDVDATAAAAAVRELEAVFAGDADDETIVEALERCGERIVAVDLAHRMTPYGSRVANLDVRDTPWAGLLVGISTCSIDRERGLEILEQARLVFEVRDDLRGLGHASLLIGNECLASGDFAAAEALWTQASELLSGESPAALLAAAHRSLALYQTGALVDAQRAAESAARRARMAGNAHAEGVASVYLAFFSWWRGSFRRVDQVAAEAETALNRIPDEDNRYEMPLVHAARACVAGLRGQSPTMELEFDAGLALARKMHNDWYEAILFVMRAESAAHWQPLRSVEDARRGIAYFETIGETWWSHWAQQAAAVAHGIAGHLHASAEILDELLDCELNPLERGRALLTRGDILAAAHDDEAARKAHLQARELLEPRGANYWTSRAEVGLATTDSQRSTYWHRAAIRRAGSEFNDPAWGRTLRGPATIELRLLGSPRILVDGVPVHFPTAAALSIVARLAVESPGGLHVETILDTYWPTQTSPRARHNLDNLLNQVRKTLNPALRLERHGQQVHLNLDSDECDVLRVLERTRALLAAPIEPQSMEELGKLQTQLGDPFLGGGFDKWTVEVQQSLDAARDQIGFAVTRARDSGSPESPRH